MMGIQTKRRNSDRREFKPIGIALVLMLVFLSVPLVAADDLSDALTEIQNAVVNFSCIIYRIIQAIVGVLAMLMIILDGIKWMTSEDPDSINEAKNRILYTIVGVLVVLLALDAVNLFAKTLGIITDDIPCDTLTSTTIPDYIKGVICIGVRILQGAAGIIAMIILTIAGFKWIAADSPEDRTEAKKLVINTIIGVLIIIIGGQALSVLFSNTKATEFTCASATKELTEELTTKIINPIQITACIILRTIQFASGFVAAIAIMFAGIKWLSSDSPEDRTIAKKMAMSAIFGFLIILIASGPVSHLFSGMTKGKKLTFDCKIAKAGDIAPGKIQEIIRPALCTILWTIQSVAGIIAAIVVMFAGIKWLSSDDPDERNKAKQWVIHAIIGFFVVIIGSQGMGDLFGSVPSFTKFNCEKGSALPQAGTTVCVIYRTIQAVAGIIAAMVIMLSGIKWLSSDEPDERNKAKQWAIHAIIGFFVVIIGSQAMGTLFTGTTTINTFDCKGDKSTSTLPVVKKTVCTIFKTIQASAAIIATIVIGIAGMKWMSFDVDFEERNKAKGLAINAIIGLLIVIVGVHFMEPLFGTDISFDCKGIGSELGFVALTLCVILNIVLAVAAVIAGIALIFAAFKWFIASGDPESRAKAKGAVFNVVVGFLIVVISAQFVHLVITDSGSGLTFNCDTGFNKCKCMGKGGAGEGQAPPVQPEQQKNIEKCKKLGYEDGTDKEFSGCTDDKDCIGDWTCESANPEKIKQAIQGSFCMTDEQGEEKHCCWNWDSKAEYNCPPKGMGKRTKCQRPPFENPKNTKECWCVDPRGGTKIGGECEES